MTSTQHAGRPTVPAKSKLDALLHEATERHHGKWLADKIGASTPEVSRWRNGLRPGQKRQEQIAKVLTKALGREITVKEIWS